MQLRRDCVMDTKSKNKKITIRFSKKMKTAMQTALIKSGYGLRGKSRWLRESIVTFLQQPNFIDYVENGIDKNQAELTEVEAFYLDSEVILLIRNASIKIREMHPLFEGVQSSLVRAGVVYRLMLK